MDLILIFSAVAAGLASFFSPCIFPLMPGYISLISGVSADELLKEKTVSLKPGVSSIFFVAGFSAAFALMGAGAGIIGGFLSNNKHIISAIAGIILVILGAHTAGVININFFNYEKRVALNKFQPGFLGAFIMGVAFAIGWSPCIGPVLAGILAMSAASETAAQGMFLLLFYSLTTCRLPVTVNDPPVIEIAGLTIAEFVIFSAPPVIDSPLFEFRQRILVSARELS